MNEQRKKISGTFTQQLENTDIVIRILQPGMNNDEMVMLANVIDFIHFCQ